MKLTINERAGITLLKTNYPLIQRITPLAVYIGGVFYSDEAIKTITELMAAAARIEELEGEEYREISL